MKELQVDRELCIGCCRCVDFAPLIFAMEDGLAYVESQPSANEIDEANNALENCPTEAIDWI